MLFGKQEYHEIGMCIAKILDTELKNNRQLVILIPAPDPRHHDHKIRVAVQRPPEWYSDLYHKGYRRQQIHNSLHRIMSNKVNFKYPVDNEVYHLIESKIRPN